MGFTKYMYKATLTLGGSIFLITYRNTGDKAISGTTCTEQAGCKVVTWFYSYRSLYLDD